MDPSFTAAIFRQNEVCLFESTEKEELIGALSTTHFPLLSISFVHCTSLLQQANFKFLESTPFLWSNQLYCTCQDAGTMFWTGLLLFHVIDVLWKWRVNNPPRISFCFSNYLDLLNYMTWTLHRLCGLTGDVTLVESINIAMAFHKFTPPRRPWNLRHSAPIMRHL